MDADLALALLRLRLHFEYSKGAYAVAARRLADKRTRDRKQQSASEYWSGVFAAACRQRIEEDAVGIAGM
eukprot:gene36624-52874_t